MKYPQLIYGMIGIFLYVGVEVTIDNNFGALLKTAGIFNFKRISMQMKFQNTFPCIGVV